jgi:hypothetical protein
MIQRRNISVTVAVGVEWLGLRIKAYRHKKYGKKAGESFHGVHVYSL